MIDDRLSRSRLAFWFYHPDLKGQPAFARRAAPERRNARRAAQQTRHARLSHEARGGLWQMSVSFVFWS